MILTPTSLKRQRIAKNRRRNGSTLILLTDVEFEDEEDASFSQDPFTQSLQASTSVDDMELHLPLSLTVTVSWLMVAESCILAGGIQYHVAP